MSDLQCGMCGMEKVELDRPSPKHSRVAYCPVCGNFSTYVAFPHAPENDGWLRNPSPPGWAKVAARSVSRPAYSWAYEEFSKSK